MFARATSLAERAALVVPAATAGTSIAGQNFDMLFNSDLVSNSAYSDRMLSRLSYSYKRMALDFILFYKKRRPPESPLVRASARLYRSYNTQDQREAYMTAQIILFPGKPADRERLAMVGRLLSDVIPMPARDLELDMLLAMAGKLIDNLNDYQAADVWLVRFALSDATKAEFGWEVA
jgi:hypothetical protein